MLTVIGQKRILAILLIIVLVGCKTSPDSNTVIKDTSTIKTEDDKVITNLDKSGYPGDSINLVKMLQTDYVFHEEEVWPTAHQDKWMGLFKKGDSYYLANTRIQTLKAHDALLDEDTTTKTGWEILVQHDDTCLYLIESVSYLQERAVQSLSLSNTTILPGEQVKVQYNGVTYELSATGRKVKDGDYFAVSDYRLYITATVNNVSKKQLLVYIPAFEEKMINILFVGDIDGDGKLDFIIDTSYHYNLTRPTLYLSKPTSDQELVKPVGMHATVGC